MRFILKTALASFLAGICWVIGFSLDWSYTETIEFVPGVTLTQEVHVHRSPLSWYGACGQYVPLPIPSSFEESTSATIETSDRVVWTYRNPTSKWLLLMAPDSSYALLASASSWFTFEMPTFRRLTMPAPAGCGAPTWSEDSQWILCEPFLGEEQRVDPQCGAKYPPDLTLVFRLRVREETE